jgi:hypothetical protein
MGTGRKDEHQQVDKSFSFGFSDLSVLLPFSTTFSEPFWMTFSTFAAFHLFTMRSDIIGTEVSMIHLAYSTGQLTAATNRFGTR